MRTTPCVQLSGRAMRFVQVLQELGHVDAESANRLLVGVGELTTGKVADLAEIRRAAAMMLFHQEEGPSQDSMMAEDWPILFS